jgi:hypothetical protein
MYAEDNEIMANPARTPSAHYPFLMEIATRAIIKSALAALIQKNKAKP